MKTKIFSFIFIALVYIFPFRYAVLQPTSSNTINLLCMLATVFGTLIFMGLTITDGESHKMDELKKEGSLKQITETKSHAA